MIHWRKKFDWEEALARSRNSHKESLLRRCRSSSRLL